MNKKLLFLLSIFLFFLILNPHQDAFAITQPDQFYLVKTANSETYLRRGAEERYEVKVVIPKDRKIVVMGEFVNSENEYWLHVEYNGVFGWIKKDGLKSLHIKSQFLISSTSTSPIRSGAQTTYKQIGLIQKGQIVRPNDVFTNSNGDRWINVTIGNVTGWVQLTNIEVFDGGKNYLNKQVLIKIDTHVKRGASYSEKSVFLIKKGEIVTIQNSFIVGGENWYRIKGGKVSGWIPAVATTNQVGLSGYLYDIKSTPVLRGADKSYRAVSTLSIGQKVQIMAKFISRDNSIWFKVKLENGNSGWVLGTTLSAKKIKIAYLTIDDGPSIYTSKLLDTLDKYNAKATFFMLNGNMNAQPKVVRRMVKEGHAVGSHGVTHDINKFYRSPSNAVSEMVKTRSTILKITGMNSNLIRVPYGSVPYMKQSYRNAVNKQHFIMWDWNVDSLDWKYNSPKYVSNILSQVKRLEKNGTVPVILIHDHKATVDSLPILLLDLEKQGYTFAPISESIRPYQFHGK
jgi:peptidoglycan/xylan/chitin deacetylase (PgdA/CDA1 family)/uncharacterized protein YraI